MKHDFKEMNEPIFISVCNSMPPCHVYGDEVTESAYLRNDRYAVELKKFTEFLMKSTNLITQGDCHVEAVEIPDDFQVEVLIRADYHRYCSKFGQNKGINNYVSDLCKTHGDFIFGSPQGFHLKLNFQVRPNVRPVYAMRVYSKDCWIP